MIKQSTSEVFCEREETRYIPKWEKVCITNGAKKRVDVKQRSIFRDVV